MNAATEVLGQKVWVVADRFHVAKWYRKGLDDVRKKEMKRLKEKWPKADYKECQGVMWLRRKNPTEFKPEELDILIRLFQHTPRLATAYVFC
jgi:LEA14-like dessication related protein